MMESNQKTLKPNQVPAVLVQFIGRLIPVTQYRGYEIKKVGETTWRVLIRGFRVEWVFLCHLETSKEDLEAAFLKAVGQRPMDVMEANSWLEQLGFEMRLTDPSPPEGSTMEYPPEEPPNMTEI